MAHSPDGFHLYTWGGTGTRGSTCLRVWSLEVDGQSPTPRASAQPRLHTAALAAEGAVAGPGGAARCVRLAVAGGESAWGLCPRFPAWEAGGSFVFAPADKALIVATIDSRRYQAHSSKKTQWNVKRHFASVSFSFLLNSLLKKMEFNICLSL